MQAADDRYRIMVRQFQRVGRLMMQGRDSQINGLRDHLNVSHQAACGLVDRMKTKGLLDVEVSGEDARAKTVSLSEIGHKVCDDLKMRGSSAGHAAFDCLTSDEIDGLAETLDKIETYMRREVNGNGL